MRGGMTLSLPPFTRAVKQLIIVNSGIFALMFLLPRIGLADAYDWIRAYGYLTVPAVLHGHIYQLVTYGFFHIGFMHLLLNMFTLWMFGAQFEAGWGRPRFLAYYFWCVIGAAVSTVLIALLGRALFAALPIGLFATLADVWNHPTAGASGGIYGLLIAFGMFYGDREIYIFPFPFLVKARYVIAVWILIALFSAFGESGGVANFAHLGGALFGWIYLRFLPSRGIGFAASEGYFGLRNRYYRWKRKKAQKKFEVYMSRHKREDYFDEYGNFKDPGSGGKGSGDPRGPWVN